MLSKYGIFCRVVELGSFTQVAREIGYSQSAVSQIVKSLESELAVTLVNRRKEGLTLTKDGEQFFPYLQAIQIAEEELKQKQKEVHGLEKSTIRIGTFTSISQNFLPPLMKSFKERYPKVNFELLQGEYTSITNWIETNVVDFGFTYNQNLRMEGKDLYTDKMLAILPKEHPLTEQKVVSLADLAKEPLILLDEGEFSVALKAFEQAQLQPKVEYKIYDDYSILAMVQQNLGVSLMYSLVLSGHEDQVEIRPIKENPERTVTLAWRNWQTMSLASRRFAEFIIDHIAETRKDDPKIVAGLRFTKEN
ncbi:LysR family transcriptional regulator [Enterococcus florum]|uniref:LysR family transcriptional regulator n=1 Tax=Enterococcus florum TaxID=2480627 RepID=A0A4P5PF18_9ENTE|nr:LysR family transcriptional regulator [Enterococcus florum]GCF94808.1 LysR family transcriptional regulator [Enterococcus florum]